MKKTKAVKEESVASKREFTDYELRAGLDIPDYHRRFEQDLHENKARAMRDVMEAKRLEHHERMREAMSMPAFDSKILGSPTPGAIIPTSHPHDAMFFRGEQKQVTTYAISEGCDGLTRKQMLEAAQWLIDALDKDEVEDD